jgi:mRNA interferase HigB
VKITNKILLERFTQKHAWTSTTVNKWIETIEDNEFANHNELKAMFPTADYVGNLRYVFNIKGNRYRLVVLVVFANGRMQVKFCGTHAEYDKIKDIKNI